MELPSILRDLKRVFSDEPEPSAEPNIFLKWNHLATDGSILFFIRHYEITGKDTSDILVVNILQSSHEREMNIDIRNAVKDFDQDVVVSVSKTFFDQHESKVKSLLDWIENEYNRAITEESSKND